MNRIIYADYLRIIGIIGVIGVHLSGDYLSKTVLFSHLWYQGLLYSSLTRSGALLFIMVSGLLLLDRPQSIDKIPHRIERVITPFIFWLLIIFLKLTFIDNVFTVTSTYDFTIQFITCLLDPTIISEEFWYIPMIIGFYLMLPLLYKLIINVTDKEIEYFLTIWFIILTLNYLNVDFQLLNYVNLFTGHLGFFILGYYMHKKNNRFTNNISLGLSLFIIGTLLTYLSIYIPTLINNELTFTYLGIQNLTPGFVFKAAGLFIVIKNINYENLFKNKSIKVNTFIMKFAEITYGLYLVHILIPIRLIYDVNINPFINIPLLTIVILIASSAILIIMNKIPILEKFTGMKSSHTTYKYEIPDETPHVE